LGRDFDDRGSAAASLHAGRAGFGAFSGIRCKQVSHAAAAGKIDPDQIDQLPNVTNLFAKVHS
jgi:hypothetical protein